MPSKAYIADVRSTGGDVISLRISADLKARLLKLESLIDADLVVRKNTTSPSQAILRLVLTRGVAVLEDGHRKTRKKAKR